MTQCHKRVFVTPPFQGRRIHMDRSGVDQKLVRRPPYSGVTAGAGWQESTAQCQRSSSHSAHFSAALDIRAGRSPGS